MINKMLIAAVLILFVGMPVMAEPAANPAQDSKAPAQEVSNKEKSKTVKIEHKRAEKTAKAIGSTKSPEAKTGGAVVPTTNDSNKKIN